MRAPRIRVTSARVGISLLLTLTLAGCHVAQPVEPTAVPPGSSIRVLLAPAGQLRLAELGYPGGDEIAGSLVSVTVDSLTMTTRLASPSSSASEGRNLRQTLTFAQSDVQRVSVPELHFGRTAAVVGGALVVVGLLVTEIFDLAGSSGGETPPPTPTPFRPSP